jgi:alpha-glucosidase
MRPVFLDYPQSEDFYGNNRDFLFGSDLFVAPVTTEMVDAEEIQLPPGDWYDYWSSQKLSSKNKITLRPALDEMPLYVRAGAIVPTQPVVQNTAEKPNGPLQLRVYSGDDCRGSLYEDDGHTFAYQRDELLRVNYSCQASPTSITVTSTTEKSSFQPWWNSAEVAVFGASVQPKEIRIGDRAIRDWRFDSATHSVIFTVPDALKDWTAQLTF